MLKFMPIVYYVYAAALLGGGLMGFKMAGSTKSIYGGAAFAAVAVIAGLLTRSQPGTGLIVGLVNAIAVAGFFFYRYLSTGKPMPAFGSIGLSVVVIALTLAAFAAARRG